MKKLVVIVLSMLILMSLIVPASFASDQEMIKRNLIGDGKGVILKLTFSAESFSKDRLNSVLQDFFDETGISVEVLYVPSTGGWAGYFSKIQTMVAANDNPDIIRIAIEGFNVFLKNDMLEPFNEYEEKFPEFAKMPKDNNPHISAPYTVDGKTYGYAFDWNNIVIHINTDLLKEVGLEMPPSDWDLEVFLDYAKKLTFTRDDGTQVYGFMVPAYYFGFSAWLFNAGGSVLNEDMTKCLLDSPEAIELVEFFRKCVHEYKVAPQPPIGDTAFLGSQVAMGSWGRWPFKTYNESEFKSVDIQFVPTIKTNQAIAGSGIFPVLKSSEHKDEAYKLAAWLSRPESQEEIMEISHIPSSTSVMEKITQSITFPANIHVFADAANIARSVESPDTYNDVQGIFDRYFSLVMANELDSESAMKAATDEINLVLAGF